MLNIGCGRAAPRVSQQPLSSTPPAPLVPVGSRPFRPHRHAGQHDNPHLSAASSRGRARLEKEAPTDLPNNTAPSGQAREIGMRPLAPRMLLSTAVLRAVGPVSQSTMTQIIAALTHEYVLVASDRRLTYASGPRKGETADDNTCKLVCLCGLWGIAYTGLSQLQGVPTHAWIALRLAEKGCRSADRAARILADAAAPALREVSFLLELTFLVTGWTMSADRQAVEPHFWLVSNMYDPGKRRRPTPGSDFRCFERRLMADELYAGRVIGQPLPNGRGRYLDRLLRRMLTHRAGPKPAMEAFVREILNTSRLEGTVGEKILAFSIPKVAAELMYQTGSHLILATEPDLRNVAFCYFDPAYSQLHQYGPTFTCGEYAVTDVETENDPARNCQSSSVRILYLPKDGPTG